MSFSLYAVATATAHAFAQASAAARCRFDAIAPPGAAAIEAGSPRPRVRRVRAGDAQAMGEFVQHALSPAARRCRFHGAVQGCSAAWLRELTTPDGMRHVAFVATVADADGRERIVGEARYVACSRDDEFNAGCAEFAIAVADGWCGSGVADRLMEALFDSARAAGLRWLYGDVLRSNVRMLGFMRRLGFVACGGADQPEDSADLDADGIVRLERGVAAAGGA